MSAEQRGGGENNFSDDELSSDAIMPDNLVMIPRSDLDRGQPPRPEAPLPFLWELPSYQRDNQEETYGEPRSERNSISPSDRWIPIQDYRYQNNSRRDNPKDQQLLARSSVSWRVHKPEARKCQGIRNHGFVSYCACIPYYTISSIISASSASAGRATNGMGSESVVYEPNVEEADEAALRNAFNEVVET